MVNSIEEHFITATVVGIEWERIVIHIDVQLDFAVGIDPDISLQFFAVNGLYKAKAIFEKEKLNDTIYRLSMNFTNPGDVQCLPVGTYRIVVCKENEILACCMAAPEITEKMEDLSRNFLYNNRSSVYAVTLLVEENEESLPFIIHTLSAKRAGMGFQMGNKIILDGTNLKHPKKIIEKNSRPFLRNVYAYYRKKYRKEGGQKKTILFMTEQSDTLGSNLMAVYNRIKERKLDEEYILLTSARMASSQRQSKKSWVEVIKKMAMSDMIFVDDHAPVLDWLKLSDDTEVIQLWHAGAGFKSSGYSRWGHKGCPSPSCAHRQYKYGIAGSKNIAHFFSEVWGINTENVLPTGMPRIDEYLDENYRKVKTKELYEQFPICRGKKVVLFAPTYRGKNRKTAYYPYELIDFQRLYDVCGDEYVVLFKMHPWVSIPVPLNPAYMDRFQDVGAYPNINDLFYITDLLITDYSSNIFEYSLMRKPMMFFAFDKIQYSFSRGFHREYELSAPGKVCYTFDELMEAFEKKDFEFEKVEEYVKHHFDFIDSHASDRVIDWIIQGNIPQDIKDTILEREKEQEMMKNLDFSVLNAENP